MQFNNQTWNELSRPMRWTEPIRPAMAELEARLPALLGASTWLHRNVSWSDLDRIGEPGTHPPAGSLWSAWPLMYLVGHYRKAQLGIRLEGRRGCAPGIRGWKTVLSAAEGLPCITYAVDPEVPALMELVLEDICREVRRARRWQTPKWQCTAGPARLDKEAACLAGRGLVKRENGVWLPTERGEDAGLITLFTAAKGGKTQRSMRWAPSTRQALSGAKDGPISLQTRLSRLEQGLACRDARAAEAVRALAEMPLEEYFRSCPEVDARDLQKLRNMLGLREGCLFRTAAAALFRRVSQPSGKAADLTPLVGLLALPISKMNEDERSFVMDQFRKGRFLT